MARAFFNSLLDIHLTQKLIATALAATLAAATGAFALDASLPAYQPVSGVAGQIKSAGSDRLNNEMADFKSLYPGVKIEVEGKSSATASPALVEGVSLFGPMSRSARLHVT